MILADTSGLLAAVDPDDNHHAVALGVLRGSRNPSQIVIPTPVIAELAYWLDVRLGPRSEAAVLRRLARSSWRVEELNQLDLLRAADLVDRYADFPLGTVDALLVAMAERLDITTVFTLDRRHFGAVRPVHCEAFELVPEVP